jgi:hypothetical protein
MITLSARCTGNAQDTAGHHTATLVSENGLTSFSLPSENLTFVPGNTYKVSIDGEFVKPPAQKAPAKYAGPERRTHAVALAPPMKERRLVPFSYPKPVAPKPFNAGAPARPDVEDEQA